MGIYSKVTRKKRISTPLPLVVLASLAAVAFPQAAAAEAKGPALPEAKVAALVELKHPRGLNRFVRAVSDPRSPRYRDYLTVEQVVARYGAKPATKRRVLGWLEGHGLEAKVSASGTIALATLPARRAERLLPRVDGALSASAGLGGPRRIPAALRGAATGVSLVAVEPLDTYAPPPLQRTGAETLAATKPKLPYSSFFPRSGTPKGCAPSRTGGFEPGVIPVAPNQYTTAYGHAAMHAKGFKGEGQSVAVVETGGFVHRDIVTWAKCFGLKPPPIRVVPVAPVKMALPGELETTLDLEMLTAGAPGLDRILVYEGGGSNTDLVLTAGSALGSPGNRPDVISMSLGICEPTLNDGQLGIKDALDDVFAVAAGAGISVLVSAGDQGSTGCRVEVKGQPATALPVTAVSLPASSPYATAVGGTNVVFNPKNQIKLEVVWNDQNLTPWGGGGGASLLSPRTPWWQTAGSRYGTGRKVPDIAALADLIPGYSFFCTAPSCELGEAEVPGWAAVGGTSAAAPLTAAGIALANQYAERRGQATLGFLNPLIYQLGAGAKSRASVFNDVTKGNNDIGRALPANVGGGKPVGCCSAKAGYDWASGWGSLKIEQFTKAAAARAR